MTDTLTPPEGDAPADDLDMGMDPWEKTWIRFSVLLLVGFIAAITVAGFAAGFQLPGDEGQVDPRSLTESPPWDAPGVGRLATVADPHGVAFSVITPPPES